MNAVQHYEQLMLLPPALMALADVMTSSHTPRKAFPVKFPQLLVALSIAVYASWALSHGAIGAALLGMVCAVCYGRLLWSRHLQASVKRLPVVRRARLHGY